MEYNISDEDRRLLDAVLPNFKFDTYINVSNHLLKIVKDEGHDLNSFRLYEKTKRISEFLITNNFASGSRLDPVINKKGMELKECGSLAAYEEKHGSKERKTRPVLNSVHSNDSEQIIEEEAEPKFPWEKQSSENETISSPAIAVRQKSEEKGAGEIKSGKFNFRRKKKEKVPVVSKNEEPEEETPEEAPQKPSKKPFVFKSLKKETESVPDRYKRLPYYMAGGSLIVAVSSLFLLTTEQEERKQENTQLQEKMARELLATKNELLSNSKKDILLTVDSMLRARQPKDSMKKK